MNHDTPTTQQVNGAPANGAHPSTTTGNGAAAPARRDHEHHATLTIDCTNGQRAGSTTTASGLLPLPHSATLREIRVRNEPVGLKIILIADTATVTLRAVQRAVAGAGHDATYAVNTFLGAAAEPYLWKAPATPTSSQPELIITSRSPGQSNLNLPVTTELQGLWPYRDSHGRFVVLLRSRDAEVSVAPWLFLPVFRPTRTLMFAP